jgi:hypothetical protein
MDIMVYQVINVPNPKQDITVLAETDLSVVPTRIHRQVVTWMMIASARQVITDILANQEEIAWSVRPVAGVLEMGIQRLI